MKRIINKELIKEISQRPCFICRKIPVDVHHVKSRKSGGHDLRDNLLPLCREHHQEVHKIGLTKFSEKYKVSSWLMANNWEFSPILNRWIKLKDAGVIVS